MNGGAEGEALRSAQGTWPQLTLWRPARRHHSVHAAFPQGIGTSQGWEGAAKYPMPMRY
jgi:hypothetical protein